MISTVLLSSVGVSAAINLNWIGGKPTSIQVSNGSTTMTADFNIQYTLDDLQRTPSTAVVWSYFTGTFTSTTNSSALHFTSSLIYDANGLLVAFSAPIAAVRLASTAISSSWLVLKVLQGEGW